MIIQCDHCSAKFRMDDAKLANGPVKVRCAKCKEVFVVGREEPPTEAEQAPSAAVPPPSPAASVDFPQETFSEGSDFSFDQEQPSVNAAAEPSPAADEFDWKDTPLSVESPGATAEFAPSSFETAAPAAVPAQATAADSDNDFDFGDINLQASLPEGKPSSQEPAQEDFSIDFGEVSFAATPAASPGTDESFTGTANADFSFDSSPAADSSAAAASDDFLLSFDTDQSAEPKAAAGGSEEVNFGDFSFGEMAEEAKEDQGATAAELPPAEKNLGAVQFQAAPDDELVPTSLASRKKSASRFPLFLILGAIVLVVTLAGSGVYFFGGPKAFSKIGLGFLVDWYAEKGPEEGNITIRNIVASYVMNGSGGELFVVRGEAVNNFKKPRASVQVKVSILGPGGAVLASKSAFCGNSLSNEQLATLPLAKIEEAMNNQFGDSLANLGVKPGSAIPFVVAVSAVPKEATDYSAQVAGSTVATQ